MNSLNFITDSLLSDDFFDDKISGIFGIMDKSRKWNFECFGCEFHVHKNLIDIDIVGLNDVSVSRIAHNVLFDFTHSDHGVVKHLFHEDSFLGMDHLIVGLF